MASPTSAISSTRCSRPTTRTRAWRRSSPSASPISSTASARPAMVTPEYCQALARYNEWMNSRLYALCATLPDEEVGADRGAFFGSIYATLNHIAYADLAFLARFIGEPAVVPDLNVDLFGGFA